MKNETFDALVKLHTQQRITLGRVKGDEYANSSDDRLNNFKRDGNALGIAPEANLLTHAGKHWASINHYVKIGCPRDDDRVSEPIIKRIYDLQNYMDLLLALLEERHNGDQFEATLTQNNQNGGTT